MYYRELVILKVANYSTFVVVKLIVAISLMVIMVLATILRAKKQLLPTKSKVLGLDQSVKLCLFNVHNFPMLCLNVHLVVFL